MLKWTVQQRRKSAADIGDDVLLLGLLSPACLAADGGCSVAARQRYQPQQSPPLPQRGGDARRAAVAAAATATAGSACFAGLHAPTRVDEVTRPRSASPRFGAAESGGDGATRSAACSPRAERHWRQVVVGAVDAGNAGRGKCSAARRLSLAPDVYNAAGLVREASVSQSAFKQLQQQRRLAESHSAATSRALWASSAVGGEPTGRDAPLADAAASSGEMVRPKEPELMFVATATSATPKMAKLRRLRPAAAARNGRSGCGAPAAADRGEKKRAATPDSGVGVALSEGESPSDEDGTDGGHGYPRESGRASTCGGQSEDYIDVDFRIQRSASDSSAACGGAACGAPPCAVNRCHSSPRLGDVPGARSSSRRRDSDAYVVRPRITIAPASQLGADASSAGGDLGCRAPDAAATVALSDVLPEPIPRCRTADASLCRPRSIVRRRLSDFGCSDGGGGGASTAPVLTARTARAMQWAPHRHLGQLTYHDWREVTI